MGIMEDSATSVGPEVREATEDDSGNREYATEYRREMGLCIAKITATRLGYDIGYTHYCDENLGHIGMHLCPCGEQWK